MAKKRRRSPFKGLLKNSSLTGLILLLLFTFYELAGGFQPLQATKLPASDEPAALYSNEMKDDLTRLYQQAIDGAQESITLAIYSLTDDHIIQALQNKCDAGIPVHVVCDAAASKGISRRLPQAEIIKRVGDGLMHQKILVIDGHQIVLGSANLTPGSLKNYGNLVFALDHPPLARALIDRIKSMDDEGQSTPLLHCETTSGSQNVELWVLPDDRGAVDRVTTLLRSAKKTIRVAMYTWTRSDFSEELIAASKRGVKVEAVVDRYAGKGAGAKIVKMLDQAGISIRLSTSQGLLHHKFAYIDEEILINGSANWTERAFVANDDCFLVVYPLTTEQKEKMNDLCGLLQKRSETVAEAEKRNKKRENFRFPH